ncbi:hypothetical protein ACH35V_21140 [Actinomadura sp. 1N219]|uniref:hypothetical protein n=1 Tax=Actinomadura sp. 1N219 TaxID=3375152 RepID=UPI00379098BD
MLTVVRAVLGGVVPAEVVIVVLLVSGVPLPRLVMLGGEVLVAGGSCWRSSPLAGWWGAAAGRCRVVGRLSERVRRIMAFDLKGLVGVALLVVGRRHGVPPGAVSVSYSGGQLTFQLAFLFAMVVETAVAELLLRGTGASAGLRSVVLVVDVYSILVVVAIIAASVTRPHVVSDDELRVRYGPSSTFMSHAVRSRPCGR